MQSSRNYKTVVCPLLFLILLFRRKKTGETGVSPVHCVSSFLDRNLVAGHYLDSVNLPCSFQHQRGQVLYRTSCIVCRTTVLAVVQVESHVLVQVVHSGDGPCIVAVGRSSTAGIGVR